MIGLESSKTGGCRRAESCVGSGEKCGQKEKKEKGWECFEKCHGAMVGMSKFDGSWWKTVELGLGLVFMESGKGVDRTLEGF